MNQDESIIRRIFLLWVVFLLAAATGCAPVQTKSTGGQAETTSAGKDNKETSKAVTQQEYLQGMLMGFADTFATKYADAISILLQQESGPKRSSAARFRFFTLAAAFDIASARYPGMGIVDMVVLVSLERIVWEEYWQPEVYGDEARLVVKTLKGLEEDVWAMASNVLTSKQLKELRSLIHEWREKHPDLHSVSFIRLDSILEMSDANSLLQKETRPGGLFAPVTKATRAVDEIRFSAERAMYMISRMQMMLSMQAEMVYIDIASQQEVRQVLSDFTSLREIADRLPAKISEERMAIMRDLESQEKTIRNVVGDVRKMIKDGNDLIALVNETTKTVDTVSARIDKLLAAPGEGRRPFDIMDYYNTVSAASDTVKQVNSLLDSAEKLMDSPNWQQRMPVVLKLADGVQTEVIKDSITQSFIYGGALILIFFMALFLTLLGYRYASIRLAR